MKPFEISLPFNRFGLAIAGGLFFFSCSSNKPLTRQDVQDNVTEAREATQEAKEKTQTAIDSRKQYYSDYRETRVRELEDRSKQIDNRIRDLKKVVKDSPNQQAVTDVNSAIGALQEEKSGLNEKISQAKAMKEADWSASYEEINQATTRIEGELDKLSNSLETGLPR